MQACDKLTCRGCQCMSSRAGCMAFRLLLGLSVCLSLSIHKQLSTINARPSAVRPPHCNIPYHTCSSDEIQCTA